MTPDQLRIFLAVAELNHVTLAAEKLNMTQSAVSGALRALEDRYGVLLFDRVGRGIRVNATGLALMDKARAVLGAVRDAEAVLDDLGQLRHGTLSVHASQTITSHWLPARLVRFRALYPGITIEARVGNTDQCITEIRNGTCDLAFVEGAVDAPSIEEEVVATDHLAVICGPDHALARCRPGFGHDFARHGWILRESGSGTRSTFEHALATAGGDPGGLNVVLELWTNEAICMAVMHSDNLGVVPWIVAEPLVLSGKLVAHSYDEMVRPFRALRHRDRHLGAAPARLLELMREMGDGGAPIAALAAGP